MGEHERILAGKRAELVGVGLKGQAREAGQLRGHLLVKARRRVEARAHGRAAQGQAIKTRHRGKKLLARALEKTAPARDLLREGDGHGILQVRATALDHALVFRLKATQRVHEPVDCGQQALCHRNRRSHVHGCGEGVVGRLAHVDRVVGMKGLLQRHVLLGGELVCAVGENLVHVHV